MCSKQKHTTRNADQSQFSSDVTNYWETTYKSNEINLKIDQIGKTAANRFEMSSETHKQTVYKLTTQDQTSDNDDTLNRSLGLNSW